MLRYRVYTFWLALIVSCTVAVAQTVVSGVVRNAKTKEPLSGAFVLGLAGSQQMTYAYSDNNGRFDLKVPPGVVIDELRVSMMGFEVVKRALTPDKTSGLEVELTEKRTELRAAQVTSSVIERKGDTLSFSVGAFKDGTERTMGDLLAKLPGITVTTSGGIRHNEKPIGKLYVEGMDLMGARYGTVTNNLSADAIDRVEVYMNHQPVRALQDISLTDRSSINIILKESIRSTWMLSGDAVLGLPPFPLFEVRSMLTNFSKKRQSLFLVKGNNDGGDILQELQQQSILGRGQGVYLIMPGEIDSDLRSRLNPGRSYLSLPKEYWYDNLSGLGSFHHLVKLGETRQLRLALQTAGEHYDETSESREEIRFADGTSLEILENRVMTDRRGYFSGTASYEDNSQSRYLSNEFSAAGQLQVNESALMGGKQQYDQLYDLPSFNADNLLKMVLRQNATRALELTSESKYRRYNHVARYVTDGREYGQHLMGQDFSTELRTSQNWSPGRHRISLSGEALLGYVGRQADAEGVSFEDVQTNGSLHLWEFRPSVRVSDAISLGGALLTFTLPGSLHYLAVQGNDNLLYPTVSPSVSLRWELSQRLELSALSSYSLTRSNPESLLDAAVMQSWRTLAVSDSLRSNTRWNNQASLRWSDMPSMFFATISGSWSLSGGDRVPSSTWLENLTFQYYLPLITTTSGWSLNGSLKKYFGLRAFVLGLEGGWIENELREYLQGIPVNYHSARLHLQLNFTSNPARWFSTNVTSSYDRNIVTGSSMQHTQMFQVEGTLRVKPAKPLSIDATGHWLWSEIPGTTISNTPLLKICASWSLPYANLFIECRNLLDATEYRRESVSAYQTSTSITALRGRQFLIGIRMTK